MERSRHTSRRCENKKRRGRDKCIKGWSRKWRWSASATNLFLVHSSQTNAERERERERNTQTMRCFARKVSAFVPLVGILELFFLFSFFFFGFLSPLCFSAPSPCSLSISAALFRQAAGPSGRREVARRCSFFRRRARNGTTINDQRPCACVFSIFIVSAGLLKQITSPRGNLRIFHGGNSWRWQLPASLLAVTVSRETFVFLMNERGSVRKSRDICWEYVSLYLE